MNVKDNFLRDRTIDNALDFSILEAGHQLHRSLQMRLQPVQVWFE